MILSALLAPARRPLRPSARSLSGWLLAAVALFAATLQAAVGQPIDGDPPSRVARLSDLNGNVWLYRPDAGDWVQATRNLPLTTGDTLATEPGARAELQVGSSTLRLDSGSELQVTVLADNRFSLQLRAGALTVTVQSTADTGPVDVSTEEGRFSVLAAGRYRFDHGSGSSFVSVDSGQVRYEYAASALTVSAGQRAEFWIDANGAAQYGLSGAVYDAFTAWNNDRDRRADRSSATARFVSPEMTGVSDLDRYGSWEQNADYGAVWVPATVAADWAPYGAGRWIWVRPWGWTWVDDAPWGFAPFHYGRWVNLRNRWCWTPGVREPRPVYAPALVGWIGPPRGGVTVGVGPAVGWFPLAPREVFVPGYRGSPRYVRDLNTPNVRRSIDIDVVVRNPSAPREFENRRIAQAVTVVPATVFGEHRSLAPAAAQYRDAPWARDFARSGGPGSVSMTAPVAAPPLASNRQGEIRPTRPAPGFAEQRVASPGRPLRDRDGVRPEPFQANTGGASAEPQRPGGGADRRERDGRGERAGSMPLSSPAPATPSVAAPPSLPTGTGTSIPGRVRPLPVRPSFDAGAQPGQQGQQGQQGQPGQPGSPQEFRQPVAAPSVPTQRQVAPAPAPGAAPDAGRFRGGERREEERRFGDDRSRPSPRGETSGQPPAMRPAPVAEPAALPVRRPGESTSGMERGAERPPGIRGAERTPQPVRSDAPPVRPEIAVPRPPEVQGPAPVQPARPAPVVVPVPAPRPVEAPAPQRRVEAPRPTPPAAEPPRVAAPERRNESNQAR